MANTGKKIVLTLNEVATPYPPGTPTGNTKPNMIGDPDYIAPYNDLTACPVTSGTTCPELIATGGNDLIQYEFSMPPSVTSNPALAKVRIKVMDSGGVTELYGITYTFPMSPQTNYKSATFTSVAAANYRIDAAYLDGADVVVTSCPNLTTVTVT